MSGQKECRKAVVMARGLGTRMRRTDSAAQIDSEQETVAATGLKVMIPVGRPFIDYVLSGLADAGFADVCLVIGPEHSSIRDYCTQLPLRRLRVHFAVQGEPRGTADAVLAAEKFAGMGEFVVINSDNYYPISALSSLRLLDGPGVVLFDRNALIHRSNIPPDRINAFASARTDSDGFLVNIVEKAAVPIRGGLVSMNCWKFDHRIFDFCRNVALSTRGELEIPAAVSDAIRACMRFTVVVSGDGVLDLSRRSDVVSVSERLKDVEVNL
jgi:dTDP-glucose pyrophosphorylase